MQTTNTDALLPDEELALFFKGVETSYDGYARLTYFGNENYIFPYNSGKDTVFIDEARVLPSGEVFSLFEGSVPPHIAPTFYKVEARTPQPSVTSEEIVAVLQRQRFKNSVDIIAGRVATTMESDKQTAQAILTAFHVSKKEG